MLYVLISNYSHILYVLTVLKLKNVAILLKIAYLRFGYKNKNDFDGPMKVPKMPKKVEALCCNCCKILRKNQFL